MVRITSTQRAAAKVRIREMFDALAVGDFLSFEDVGEVIDPSASTPADREDACRLHGYLAESVIQAFRSDNVAPDARRFFIRRGGIGWERIEPNQAAYEYSDRRRKQIVKRAKNSARDMDSLIGTGKLSPDAQAKAIAHRVQCSIVAVSASAKVEERVLKERPGDNNVKPEDVLRMILAPRAKADEG